MPETGVVEIVVNCPDAAVADRIAAALIDRKLAAAVNIHAPVRSLYVWKGERTQRNEVPLVAKTRPELFDRAAETIREMHGYETPSIIGRHVDRVNADFAAWVREVTLDPG